MGVCAQLKESDVSSTLDNIVKQVQTIFEQIIHKSFRRTSREIQLPTPTVLRVLTKQLHETLQLQFDQQM